MQGMKVSAGKHISEKILNTNQITLKKLKERGYDVKSYIGFSMTFPYVNEAVEKAYKDKRDTLILTHQGAQHSKVTSGILFRDVMAAVKNYPDWKVKVIGIKSFQKKRSLEI